MCFVGYDECVGKSIDNDALFAPDHALIIIYSALCSTMRRHSETIECMSRKRD